MSQYALKDVESENTIALTWHGESTLVRIGDEGEKTLVKTGDTVEVPEWQAKKLLSYSHQWTLKGDKPVVHGYEIARKKAVEARDARMKARIAKKAKKAVSEAPEAQGEATEAEGTEAPELTIIPLTEADVDAMDTKKDVIDALKERGAKANRNASLDELKALLKETLTAAPVEAAAEADVAQE